MDEYWGIYMHYEFFLRLLQEATSEFTCVRDYLDS